MCSWPSQNGHSCRPADGNGFEVENRGTLVPFGGDDDPAAGDGIFTQFGHELSLQRFHIEGTSHQFYRAFAGSLEHGHHVKAARLARQPLQEQI